MPFVQVPKDLTKIKTKVAFNLTKRQIICFSLAAAVGIPTYLFTKDSIGSEAAVLLMIGLMLPFFFFAMYEKDGQSAEKMLIHFVRATFIYPRMRIYKTNNLYAALERHNQFDKEVSRIENNQSSRKKHSAKV